MTAEDRATAIAVRLMKLGVSQAGIRELLSQHPYDKIERQLDYLPERKARRPEAFIIEAVRNDYSPPKDHHRAKNPTSSPGPEGPVDQDPELCPRPPHADPEGHRTPGAPHGDPEHSWLGTGGQTRHFDLPPVEGHDWPAEPSGQ